jgi:hypothetical protein
MISFGQWNFHGYNISRSNKYVYVVWLCLCAVVILCEKGTSCVPDAPQPGLQKKYMWKEPKQTRAQTSHDPQSEAEAPSQMQPGSAKSQLSYRHIHTSMSAGVTLSFVNIKLLTLAGAPMAHSCNPSCLGGRDQEDHGLKPSGADSL